MQPNLTKRNCQEKRGMDETASTQTQKENASEMILHLRRIAELKARVQPRIKTQN